MEKNFAEKVTIKAGGAFRNFPRFALAHCIEKNGSNGPAFCDIF